MYETNMPVLTKPLSDAEIRATMDHDRRIEVVVQANFLDMADAMKLDSDGVCMYLSRLITGDENALDDMTYDVVGIGDRANILEIFVSSRIDPHFLSGESPVVLSKLLTADEIKRIMGDDRRIEVVVQGNFHDLIDAESAEQYLSNLVTGKPLALTDLTYNLEAVGVLANEVRIRVYAKVTEEFLNGG